MELIVVLLILPVLWAVVLLPYWVRYLRERRAGRSVAVPGRRRPGLQQHAAVRYVFGAYDPYRDGVGWGSATALERDMSYVPRASRPASAQRHAYGQDFNDHSYVAGHDAQDDDIYVDGYTDRAHDEAVAYGDPYEDLAEVQELPRVPRVAASGLQPSGTPVPSRRNGRGPVGVTMPRASALAARDALRRRRQIFFTLVLGFLVSLGTGAWFGTVTAWGVHGVAVMLLASYVSLLVRHHQHTAERSSKVHRLSPVPSGQPARRPAVVVLSGGSAR